jgi:chemotaxis protein MotB
MHAMNTWPGVVRAARGYGWPLALAALLASVSGCVSSGKYDAMVAERDALEQKVGALEEANREFDSQLEERTARLDEMAGVYESLVRDLKAEVVSGHVQIEQLRDGIRVNVAEEILFPSGYSELNERGRQVLGRVAADLADTPHLVKVVGHTDNVQISRRLKSRYPTNWELGAARAASVVRLFQEQGIDGARLEAVSRGPFTPIASNDTSAGRAKNRRIEIRLLPNLSDSK